MLILCEYDFEPFPHKVQVNYAVICAEKAKKNLVKTHILQKSTWKSMSNTVNFSESWR